MSIPITLLSVGEAVLTEGIKFLYEQAAEALKLWRERRKETTSDKDKTASTQNTPPSIFTGKLAPLEVHLDSLEPLKEHLLKLHENLANYADGLESVDLNDQQLLKTVDALRQVMEAIYQQRLTFIGEQRVASGPVVEGRIDVEIVSGQVAAVEAKHISNGRVLGTSQAKKVEKNGTVIGVKVDKIGG